VETESHNHRKVSFQGSRQGVTTFGGSAPPVPLSPLFLMEPVTPANLPNANLPRRLSREDWNLINFVVPTPVVLVDLPKVR
jgi:hypothetical protein